MLSQIVSSGTAVNPLRKLLLSACTNLLYANSHGKPNTTPHHTSPTKPALHHPVSIKNTDNPLFPLPEHICANQPSSQRPKGTQLLLFLFWGFRHKLTHAQHRRRNLCTACVLQMCLVVVVAVGT